MRELKRYQIKKIINMAFQAAVDSGRNELELHDIYKIAEGVKGERLTKKEKLIIAGLVRRRYATKREVRDNKLKLFLLV